jgi:diguanylate cyclase (GGDEF)-like protein
LLAVQLVGISILLLLARQMFIVNLGFIGQHRRLVHGRQQMDQIAARLTAFAEAEPGTEERERQIEEVSRALRPGAASAEFLSDSAADLPAETAAVQQAASELSRVWEAAQSRGRDSRGRLQLESGVSTYACTMRLWHTLDRLRGGIDRLDEEGFNRFENIQQVRWLGFVLVAINWALILVSFGYAVQLYRRLRNEELARFLMRSELASERAALEKRVQGRTAALEAEVFERQRAERLNRGRNRMLEMVARNEPIADIFNVLAATVADFRSTWTTAVHSLSSGSLKLMASAGLNDKIKQHLRSISTSFAGAPESLALASGDECLIEDLGAEHKPWSELLRANGLVSVWSAPFVAAGSEALGTLSVYSLLQWKPSAADMEMLEMARHMAALVLERSRLQAQLIEHAYHDSLTGLPNRRLARDRIANGIKRAARSGQGMAVLWIDLDRFKQVNDQYGHPVGDAVLQQVSERLSGRLRTSDTLARMGGDEFMVLVEGTSTREAAEGVAVDLLAVLAQPMKIEELELGISASIGIALYPEDGTTGDSLAQHADQAMYAAKFGCCGFRAFSLEMDREPAERRELEAELSQALENGGFTLAYQPQCLPDGAVEGFEALLRFHSPRLGEVPPSRFIPIAEETQLIVPLGAWVLREVCRQSEAWKLAGHTAVPIAVNISALQFAQDDFADTVAGILSGSGAPGAALVLELTESIVMNDFTESARQMERLKRLGVRIAIDDFGTGYSSLSYLHRLPIDVLKIDRSFIENLNQPDGSGPIVEAVLSMAHTLGLRVVAEGVETARQLDTLEQRGCDLIQGYLFSRPVPAEVAAGFLRSGRVERSDPADPGAAPITSEVEQDEEFQAY